MSLLVFTKPVKHRLQKKKKEMAAKISKKDGDKKGLGAGIAHRKREKDHDGKGGME